MKAKHTPGPWQILPEEADKDYIRIRGTVLGGSYKVANVPTPTYEGVPPMEVEETRANARLIAAAPELLAALEAFRSEVPDNRHSELAGVDPFQIDESVLNGIDAAIARAKGE